VASAGVGASGAHGTSCSLTLPLTSVQRLTCVARHAGAAGAAAASPSSSLALAALAGGYGDGRSRAGDPVATSTASKATMSFT
jgi:hypothetical protein